MCFITKRSEVEQQTNPVAPLIKFSRESERRLPDRNWEWRWMCIYEGPEVRSFVYG